MLFTATARVIGEYMRKHIMDNPICNSHTRVASAILDRDLRLALEELFEQLLDQGASLPPKITYDFSVHRLRVRTGYDHEDSDGDE